MNEMKCYLRNIKKYKENEELFRKTQRTHLMKIVLNK